MSKGFERWITQAGCPDLEDAFNAGRALGRREMKGEAVAVAEAKGGWVHLPTVRAICNAIEAIPEEVGNGAE